MRYAVLADIHANLEGLQVVLNDAKELGVTHYACLGDLVGYNANPVECLEIIDPDSVELILKPSFDFQKKVLETPEHQTAIRQLIERLTGIRAEISVRVVRAENDLAAAETSANISAASNPGDAGEKPRLSTMGVRDDVEPNQDVFVQDVVDVFGAKIDRVINAPVRRDVN